MVAVDVRDLVRSALDKLKSGGDITLNLRVSATKRSCVNRKIGCDNIIKLSKINVHVSSLCSTFDPFFIFSAQY